VNVPDLVAAKGQVVDRGAVLPQRRGGDVPLGVVGGLGFGAVPAEMDDPRLLPGGVGGRVEEGAGADARHRELQRFRRVQSVVLVLDDLPLGIGDRGQIVGQIGSSHASLHVNGSRTGRIYIISP
jgi:hypothetical protein